MVHLAAYTGQFKKNDQKSLKIRYLRIVLDQGAFCSIGASCPYYYSLTAIIFSPPRLNGQSAFPRGPGEFC